MNAKETIALKSADLRALAWEDATEAETYHCERGEGSSLAIVGDEANDEACYGASARLPDGRDIIYYQDCMCESHLLVGGLDAADCDIEVTVDGEAWRHLDWSDITGFACTTPQGDNDRRQYAAKAEAVRAWVAAFYAAGGVAILRPGEYDNLYAVYLVRKAGDPDVTDAAECEELDEERAAHKIRLALLGDDVGGALDYTYASVYFADARVYGLEIATAEGDHDTTDIDMTQREAVEMAERQIADGAKRVRVVEVGVSYRNGGWQASEPEVFAVYKNPRA